MASATADLAVVAMSGGVDSAVAAALLLEAGYRVEGVSLRLWDAPRAGERICSDHRDAGRIAAHLGISHTLLDERARFESTVVAPFVDAYVGGRTPNPCMACNSRFKLGSLLDWAQGRGARLVATGHYARVERRGAAAALLRGADRSRDQSYFLFELGQRQLARITFPLGDLTKTAVRARARSIGIPVAEKLDSQDLCFGDPAALARSRGLGGRHGEVVDEDGRRLAGHGGIEGFTIGQRRGLGVAAAKPLYVQAIEGEHGRVVVAARPPQASGLVATRWNWVGEPPDASETFTAQIRSRQPGLAARVVEGAGPGQVRVLFERPALAVSPGQAVVVYRGEEVVGGGWIERAL